MKKIINILVLIFTFFLIEGPIWNNNEIINFILFAVMFVIDLIIIFKTKKSDFRIDKIDLLILSVPIIYIIHMLFGLNVFSVKYNFYYIIPELIVSITLLILRRYLSKEHINVVLEGLVYGSIFYFGVSLFATDGVLSFLGIGSVFGDTYITSIDRMYGTLFYCNSSALWSLISFFICFYKSKDDKDKYFYKVVMLMNLIAVSYTFSKMVTIIFILLFIVFIIYSFIKKNYNEVKRAISELTSMIIPVFISISSLRMYLINKNILIFILTYVLVTVLYLLINLLLEYLMIKKKVVYIFFVLLLCGLVLYLFVSPVSIPLKINNVRKENDYYITDIIFKPDSKNKIEIEYYGEGSFGFFLEALVEKNNVPEIINAGEFKNNILEFTAEDVEYYLLKIKGLNKDTNIKINKVLVNGEEYLINSLLVPYSLVHQKELTLYDAESAGNRFKYYRDALGYSKENYFLYGGGKMTFGYKRINEKDRDYFEVMPHSYFFELIIDIGFLGGIYIILIYIIGSYKMIKNWKQEEYLAIYSIFCGISILLMFDPIMIEIVFKALYLFCFIVINDLGVNKFKKLKLKS